MTVELAVQKREAKENTAKLRGRGAMPAVFYGPKEETTPIAVDATVFEKLWREAGESTIVTLTGVGGAKEVLIHDVDVHPVSGRPQHADFYVIEKGKKIEVAIPIEFIGEAPVEKTGGIVVKVLHEIEIEVSPAELPQHFEIDLSKLENIGDHISAADIPLPTSATLITDPEETIVSVKEATEEPAEIPTEPEGGFEAQEAAADAEKESTEE